jgi:hypothetical protein
MADIASAFAQGYVEARGKFTAAAITRGLDVERHVHPTARGAEDEALSVDIARWGSVDASGLLVVTSGTHGVEGYCGSGCQVGLLGDPAIETAIRSASAAILLYHAVNPYGFSHTRRGNEDNIDLNRNFRDFSQPIAPNLAYAEIANFIVPTEWPPGAEDQSRMAEYLQKRGGAALQAAVTGGQHEYADGMFFGGRQPAWSNRVLREVLRREGAKRQSLVWIDIHTGLGPPGHGEKIFTGPNDRTLLERAASVFGNDVTSIYDGSSTSAVVTGGLYNAALEECAHAEFTGIALEYGTLRLDLTLKALRAEQWLANHPEAPASQHAAIKREMRDAFYVDTTEWKAMVYGQARVAVLQGLRALASTPAAGRTR